MEKKIHLRCQKQNYECECALMRLDAFNAYNVDKWRLRIKASKTRKQTNKRNGTDRKCLPLKITTTEATIIPKRIWNGYGNVWILRKYGVDNWWLLWFCSTKAAVDSVQFPLFLELSVRSKCVSFLKSYKKQSMILATVIYQTLF